MPDHGQYYERNQVTLNKRRVLIAEAKDVPCKNCGEQFDPVAMDLHHRNGDGFGKAKGSFIRFAMQVSIERLKSELEKCDVYCANCHRILHFSKEIN